ncbi:DNA polymerase delta, subunit 4 [Ostreococcus tauri]|uniref:DNA polymerase delta, subunit 4 n=1 Tax=Ostreococcus tauri TaxID=70448 RepID=A0A090M9A7_OSTTA|nr:DNA polymerase delta, subunit 4 [Ostreococcus tauri]CEF98734.1 DNA polymerase delta, subunit 4 [Ostreococcus tauri]|eukprot:XP_022839435.1 DNA polymerase delta, subunit 4 [Ostreococcus tauri]
MAPRSKTTGAIATFTGFEARKPGARGSRKKPRQRVASDGAREGDDDAWDASVERDARALKTFDLTSAFGPCVGLTRVERWDRAASLGLDPPKVVLEILQRRPTTAAWRECVWHGRL